VIYDLNHPTALAFLNGVLWWNAINLAVVGWAVSMARRKLGARTRQGARRRRVSRRGSRDWHATEPTRPSFIGHDAQRTGR